jgi:hypothetical protein
MVALSVSLALLGTGFIACEDEDPNPPPDPNLENVWPNQDGQYWVYAMQAKAWVQSFSPYATPEMVPAAPTMVEATALLELPLSGTPVSSVEATYRMQFDGRTTTLSGAEGQNLAAFVDDQPVSAVTDLAARLGTSPGMLVQLWKARRDVRPRLIGAAKATGFAPSFLDSFDVIPTPPTFLSGGAWERGESWIGLYGDLDLDLGWKYLEANLEPGQEFTFQLLKSLASDVFLHARVNRRVTVRTAHATYVDALEVVYLVDFGVTEVAGPLGEIAGYTRPFSIGAVLYAPLAGPVWNEERALYHVGDMEPSGPLESSSLDLQDRGRTR